MHISTEDVKHDFILRCHSEQRLVNDHIRMATQDKELIRSTQTESIDSNDKDWIVPCDGSLRDGYVKYRINSLSDNLPDAIKKYK